MHRSHRYAEKDDMTALSVVGIILAVIVLVVGYIVYPDAKRYMRIKRM